MSVTLITRESKVAPYRLLVEPTLEEFADILIEPYAPVTMSAADFDINVTRLVEGIANIHGGHNHDGINSLLISPEINKIRLGITPVIKLCYGNKIIWGDQSSLMGYAYQTAVLRGSKLNYATTVAPIVALMTDAPTYEIEIIVHDSFTADLALDPISAVMGDAPTLTTDIIEGSDVTFSVSVSYPAVFDAQAAIPSTEVVSGDWISEDVTIDRTMNMSDAPEVEIE